MPFFPVPARPDEKNATIIRSLKFIEQANQIMERKLFGPEDVEMLKEKIGKLTSQIESYYDAENRYAINGEKLSTSMKTTYELSVENMENRVAVAELSRELEEYKGNVQRKYHDIRQLTESIQSIKLHQKEYVENKQQRLALALKYNEILASKTKIIKKNLEETNEASNLRKLEEEQRMVEGRVAKLRLTEQMLKNKLAVLKATLKSENKKPFKNIVVECARSYHVYSNLAPKLAKSSKNVEDLKAEEAKRRASGSIDETVLFDNSFVQASMVNPEEPDPKSADSEKQSNENQQKNSDENSILSVSNASGTGSSVSGNGLDVSIFEQHPTEKPVLKENANVLERVEEAAPPPPPQILEDENEEVEEEVPEEAANDEKEQDMEQDEEEDDHDKSIDVIADYGEKEQEGDGDTGFFDKLLTNKSEEGGKDEERKEKSAADAILDISMNSTDEAGDLLKEINGRMEGEHESDSQGSGSGSVGNFSFNIFGGAGGSGGSNANESTNFDFNFGGVGSGEENNGDFNFVTDGPSDADPFGFGKGGSDENASSSFNFNFDTNSDSGAGTSGASFFNF